MSRAASGLDRSVEQRLELVAELLLRRVDAAVGVDQLVDRREQLVLVVAVEALEDLVAAQLELGVDELLDVLAVGDGLVEQLLARCGRPARTPRGSALVNLLITSSRVFGSASGIAVLRARGDQLADVDPDERLLGEVELAIDVPERGQVEDDRVHLLLGDVGIRAEREHRPSELASPREGAAQDDWACASGSSPHSA